MSRRQVVIAGAGASGLFAARLIAAAGCQVTVIEKNAVPGKKLSMTGNGRCNLSNLDTDASCYNPEARETVKRILSRFGVKETIAAFSEAGILLRDEEGALYPVSGQATEVVNALYDACLRAGVTFVFETQVKRIEKKDGGGYTVRADKASYDADTVVLSTGGCAGPKSTMSTGDGYYLAELLGAASSKRLPALVRLIAKDTGLSGEHGVRATVRCTFEADGEAFASEYGEVQITKEALSGIPVLQASGDCARLLDEGKSAAVTIDFFPEVGKEEYEAMWKGRVAQFSDAPVEALLRGTANAMINEAVLARAGIAKETVTGTLSAEMLSDLFSSYRAFRVEILRTDGFTSAQVTRGGVLLSDLTDTLEIKQAPGVYVTGELPDVDGRCGGYNLQWAWSSAMCVAKEITGA